MNPAIDIWLRPESTVREMLEYDYGSELALVVMVSGFVSSTSSYLGAGGLAFRAGNAGATLNAAALLGGGLGTAVMFLLVWHVGARYLEFVATWFGGGASIDGMRTALGWWYYALAVSATLGIVSHWVPVAYFASVAMALWSLWVLCGAVAAASRICLGKALLVLLTGALMPSLPFILIYAIWLR